MSTHRFTKARRRALRAIIAACAFTAAAFAGPAAAQDAASYPNRPLKFVVPFPPGSGAEVAARFVGSKITAMTGQPVVIDPRGGGNGFIAVQATLAAPADGYTLFFGSNSTLATNVALFKKLPYDPLSDFQPISPPDGKPLIAVLRVKAADGAALAATFHVDGAWVINGAEVWTASVGDEKLASAYYEVVARDGPKWGPNVSVDVVVRIREPSGSSKLLRAAAQVIQRTD